MPVKIQNRNAWCGDHGFNAWALIKSTHYLADLGAE